MNTTLRLSIFASAAVLSLGLSAGAQAQQSDMSFFVTSVGSGKGGDLGGLAGADAHCQQLAQAAGAGGKTWRAYLSSNSNPTNPGATVNARDRIGKGPWKNAKGVVIATSVDDLHSANNKISKETALDEKGKWHQGRWRSAQPARHADRVRHGGEGIPAQPQPDLQQLVEQQLRQRDARTHGSER